MSVFIADPEIIIVMVNTMIYIAMSVASYF